MTEDVGWVEEVECPYCGAMVAAFFRHLMEEHPTQDAYDVI